MNRSTLTQICPARGHRGSKYVHLCVNEKILVKQLNREGERKSKDIASMKGCMNVSDIPVCLLWCICQSLISELYAGSGVIDVALE